MGGAVLVRCYHCHLSLSPAGACCNERFVLVARRGEGAAAKPTSLVCHVIVPYMEEAADATGKHVLCCHFGTTAITMHQHVQHQQEEVVAQTNIVAPLLGRASRAVEMAGRGGEPAPCTARAVHWR